MKLIQIFALMAALAAAAAAQNTAAQGSSSSGQTPANNQKSSAATPASGSKKTSSKSSSKAGPGSQTGPIKLTVVNGGKQSSTSANKKTAAPAAKPAAAPVSSKTSIPAGKASNTTSSQKAQVVGVNPAKKTTASGKGAATTKTVQKKPATGEKKAQVKVVAPKTSAANKPAADNDTGKAQTRISAAGGRRDPFLSIIRTLPNPSSTPNCRVPGKHCLYIPELVVKGIAKDTDGQMMAVVVGGAAQRAYFLRENDQVFNGSVEKITSDSVIFREFATDSLGRESAHEVVKRIPKT